MAASATRANGFCPACSASAATERSGSVASKAVAVPISTSAAIAA